MAQSPPPPPGPGPHEAGGAPPLPAGFSPLEPEDPVSVGPFRLVGRIGAGGMGAVYGALDAGGRRIAVKVIHPRYTAEPAYRATFAREAELLSRVDAECAPEFLGADTAAPRPWLATEFVQGDTLRRHTAEYGPLTGEALRAFAAGTAEALSAVHAAGIVHRDVKPANIILGPGGPRVIDFGIARSLDDTTPEEGVYGTPGWVAPERLGRAASPAADTFAWGALVAYAATGRGPFGTGDAGTLLRRAREGAADLDGVPEDLAPLVRRALAPDPQQRPTAAEVLDEVLLLSGAAEPGADRRGGLRNLLGSAWQGFGAAGRGAGPWVAAAAVLSASAAAGGGTVAAGGAAAGAAAGGTGAAAGTAGAGAAGTGAAGAGAGAGTVLGMSKGVAAAVAAATSAAVIAGGWVAGRAVAGDPEPAPPPSPSPTRAAYPQTVDFRTMTVGFPEDWNVQRVQDDFAYLGDDGPIPAEWVAVFPGGGSCETDLTWTTVSAEGCEHIKILGPEAIERGGPGLAPVDERTYYIPSTDVSLCPEGVATRPFNRNEAESGPSDDVETAPIGDLEAYYNEFAVPCVNSGTGRIDLTYAQRLWLLPDSGILVVDNIGVPELDDMLAQAETGG
ncbi:serine/threonine-protein kinase [Streptomonospora arabica]|uniref:Serine/threonine-protein kinase n=1 Tax=Streptomonospora arabica TaxID=412417 RepID=A0ABV9SJK2_9ACTN